MMNSFIFDHFETIWLIMFFVIMAMIVITAINGLMRWHHNNQSPKLIVDATVVTKRTKTTHSQQNHTTWYYVTFEVESGDRMEFKVDGHKYGMLAEGDFGRLSFQGTRYLGFEREVR